MSFHENLKRLRKRANLKRKDMAEILSMHPNAYGMYEAGTREPNIEKLCKIAAALHVSTDELLGHKLDKYGRTFNRLNSWGFTIEQSEKEESPVRISYGAGAVRDFWTYSSKEALYTAIQQAQNDIEELEKHAASNILRAKFYSDLSQRYEEIFSAVKDKNYASIEEKLRQPPDQPGIIEGGRVFVFNET